MSIPWQSLTYHLEDLLQLHEGVGVGEVLTVTPEGRLAEVKGRAVAFGVEQASLEGFFWQDLFVGVGFQGAVFILVQCIYYRPPIL